MSVIQLSSDHNTSDNLHCPHCDASIPDNATYCGTCGARIEKSGELPLEASIKDHYRITSLLRRNAPVQLFLATHRKSQRKVVIRDIDVEKVANGTYHDALATWQEEFTLMQEQKFTDIMRLIDLCYFQNHFYSIAAWPFPQQEAQDTTVHLPPVHTLDDLLQSGIGLPEELTAIAWIHRLCQAVENLHQQDIIISDLDPRAIIVSGDDYTCELALAVSWLPKDIRALLPQQSILFSKPHFIAPEVRQGEITPEADIYSLGAILYLLLTGIAPGDPTQRKQHPLRPPQELNSQVNSELETITMKALALDRTERFQSVSQMDQALMQVESTTKLIKPTSKSLGSLLKRPLGTSNPGTEPEQQTQPEEPDGEKTVLISPLQTKLARRLQKSWQGKAPVETKQQQKEPSAKQETAPSPPPAIDESDGEPTVRIVNLTHEKRKQLAQHMAENTAIPTPRKTKLPEGSRTQARPKIEGQDETPTSPTVPQEKDTVEKTQDGAASRNALATPSTEDKTQQQAHAQPDTDTVETLPEKISTSRALQPLEAVPTKTQPSFLKRLQRFILGEQQHSTTAAAIIETPMRIRPEQTYTIRIQIMGRNTAGKQRAGLSGLVQGEIACIEIRAALYQSYAYIVQHARVKIPAAGYAAEVTIPMHPLVDGSVGRRERLHLVFMDEDRNPLYEKPFVLEVFVSHLVQAGQEGYNALTIPI